MMGEQTVQTDQRSLRSSTDLLSSSEEDCPECHGTVYKDGTEFVCTDCGLIVEVEDIDRHRNRWRDKSKRLVNDTVQSSSTTERRHDKGLGSEIGYDDIDNPRLRAQFGRIRKFNQRQVSTVDRNTIHLLDTIRRICSLLGMNDNLTDRACRLAKEAREGGLPNGESIEAVATSTIIAAIRDKGIPIQMSEVRQYTDVTSHESYRLLKYVYENTSATATCVEPIDYLPKMLTQLEADETVRQAARNLLLKAQADQLHIGKKPTSITASAVYAAGQKVGCYYTQKEVANIANVSRPSIREYYPTLLEYDLSEELSS